MDYLFIHDILESIEVRNVKQANRLDRLRQRLRSSGGRSALAQVSPQYPEQPRSIEALAVAVVAEAHRAMFAIVGEPKQKSVDLTAEPPTEKWQHELPSLTTRIVTFKEGKVTKIDEF